MLRGVMNTARKVSFPSRFECFPCLVKYLPESYWGTYNKSSCSRPAKNGQAFHSDGWGFITLVFLTQQQSESHEKA